MLFHVLQYAVPDIAQLLETGVDDVANRIGDDQHHRHGEAEDQRVVAIGGAVEAVDDALIGKGDQRGGNLAEQQRSDGVGPHRTHAMGEDQPAFLGLQGRAAVAEGRSCRAARIPTGTSA